MVRNTPMAERVAQFSLPHQVQQAGLGQLDRRIDEALVTEARRIVLDTSEVQVIDSASLHWLLALQARLSAAGCELLLARPSPILRDVLLATRLESRLKIADVEGGAARG